MKQTHDDGTPILCKWCKEPVWFDDTFHRVFEPGGVSLHVRNCPRRAEWFKDRAYDMAQVKRDRRVHPLDRRPTRRRRRRPTA